MTASDLSAQTVIAAVRVHADRVHDAVRRLGCPPDAAVEVVETSALNLVDTLAREPGSVADPVGWWFARARALGRAATGRGEDDDLPTGGGVLGGDANQVRLAEALEGRPERERAALLLRDSYDLPATTVGTVLGVDAQTAMEVVGAARLAFLPALLGGPVLSFQGHQVELGALARLGEGGQLAARDATTRRHVQSCGQCADVVDAQERARRVLTGLTVVALPDAIRAQVLGQVEARALAVLPEAPEPVEEWEDEDDRRGFSISLLLLGLLLAAGAGIGIGVLLNREGTVTPAEAVAGVALVTPAPVLSVPAGSAQPPTPTPSVSPSPRVFLITPSPVPPTTPPPTLSPTPSPTIDREQLSLELLPSSGPNNTEITVNGRGWTPGAFVTLEYRRGNNPPGSTATVLVDERGRFTTLLTARDPEGLPGQHDVVADDGANRETATFTATI